MTKDKHVLGGGPEKEKAAPQHSEADNTVKDSDIGYHENKGDDSGRSFDSVALHYLYI